MVVITLFIMNGPRIFIAILLSPLLLGICCLPMSQYSYAQSRVMKQLRLQSEIPNLRGAVKSIEETVVKNTPDLKGELLMIPDETWYYHALSANWDTLVSHIEFDFFGYITYDSSYDGLKTYSYMRGSKGRVEQYAQRDYAMFSRQPFLGWSGGRDSVKDSIVCTLIYGTGKFGEIQAVKTRVADVAQLTWKLDYDDKGRVTRVLKFYRDSLAPLNVDRIVYCSDNARLELSGWYGYHDTGRATVEEHSRFFDNGGFLIYYFYNPGQLYRTPHSQPYEVVYVNDDFGNPIVTTVKPSNLPWYSIRTSYRYDEYGNWIERTQQYEFTWAVKRKLGRDEIVEGNKSGTIVTHRTISYH